MEEASKLVGAGKKFLVVGKPVEAVRVLQDASAMLAKEYGDTADECGEAFFWCGKALLDLARMENSVLGNALEGVPEEDEDEDKPGDPKVETTENLDEKTRDELRVQVYDAMAEKEKEGDKVEKLESGDGETVKAEADKNAIEAGDGKSGTGEKETEQEEEPPSKDKVIDEQKEPSNEETSDKPEEVGDEEEEGDGEEEEEQDEMDATAEKDSEDEDVGNLQLAWEMLEVAKTIYRRKDTKEDQLMAAQAHLKLGEVSAESGNYTQALEDFQECLKLQTTHLDSDSRLLAETHYQLGVTYSLDLQYSKAVDALNNSISVIKSRLERLQEMLDKAEGPEALPDERKEMDELRALLPEIQEKVEDATEGAKAASTVTESEGVSISESVNSSDSSSSSAVKSSLTSKQDSTVPVSDISHLVRKKRKPEESPVKKGDAKKAKQDDEPQTNGHKANEDSNRLAEKMDVEK